MGLVRASFGALQYAGMINLAAHLHHVYTDEELPSWGICRRWRPKWSAPSPAGAG